MKIQLNDLTFTYDHSGSGINILFVHGYPLSRAMWKPQILGLSQSASVYAVDLRGHGESSDVQKDYSMDLFADDLAAFITTLEVKQPVILCGLSMGGYATFAFYRKYPHLVAGLVLASTRAAADSPEAKLNREKAIETVSKQGREVIFQGMLPKLLAPATPTTQPELVETVYSIMVNAANAETVVKDLRALKDRQDATQQLPGIKVPTLIIHGADDQIIPLGEAQGMQAMIPESRLVILQNAGHLPNLEQPERFNAAIAHFLEQFS